MHTRKSLDLIDKYDRFWMQMKSGSQGFSGKKTVNALTMFDQLFSVEESSTTDDSDEDRDEVMIQTVE